MSWSLPSETLEAQETLPIDIDLSQNPESRPPVGQSTTLIVRLVARDPQTGHEVDRARAPWVRALLQAAATDLVLAEGSGPDVFAPAVQLPEGGVLGSVDVGGAP